MRPVFSIDSIGNTASNKFEALICSLNYLFSEVTLYLCKSTGLALNIVVLVRIFNARSSY